MLAADFGTCASELEKEVVVLSFPKRYFDDPGDYDTPVVKVGLWGTIRGLFKWRNLGNGRYPDPQFLHFELATGYLWLDDLLGMGSGHVDEFWFEEDEEVSEEIIFETAKECWERYLPNGCCPPSRHGLLTQIEQISFVPDHVRTFIVRKRSDKEILGVLATLRYEWDDDSQSSDYDTSHLVLYDEEPYKILLTPYDA